MNNKRSVTDFFEVDKPAFSSYDNLRKIPSYIDGLKVSQRKLLWTGFEKASKDFIKTDTFCAITQLQTAYIHGAASLQSVCTSLVQEFPGAGNYSLFLGNSGGWGNLIFPDSVAAARYTKLKLKDLSKIVFDKNDNEILEKQFFEGQYIEPRYLIPIFPLIFLNSSEGLSTGFSSTIYPRNPDDIITYIKKKLNGINKPKVDLLPWFKNFKGTVKYNSELNVNQCFGKIIKLNNTTYEIHDIPIGLTYSKYINILDKLVEDKIIEDYDDRCDPKTDIILFVIKTTRDFTKKHSDEFKLLKDLHLIRNLNETLNCIDENNRVCEFTNIESILDKFIDIRLKFYDKRKEHILETIKKRLEMLASKYIFIKGIIDGNIIVNKKKKEDIIKQLEKQPKIAKINDSYDYLLNMQIFSLTAEKLEELKKSILENKEEFKKVSETSIQEMWTEDLKSFKKVI